jgi:hypothetical protein
MFYNKLYLYGKYIIFLIGVSYIVVACSHDRGYDERKKDGLKGNVKTCLTHYNSIDKVYDTGGEIITTRHIALSHLETFNRKGQLEKIEYFNREEGVKPNGYEIPIREKGEIVEIIGYTEEKKISYRIKYYNISDSIVEYELFDKEGKKTSYGKTISQHDENRNTIYRKSYIQHKFDSYVWYEYLEFDKKGNWIKGIEYYGEGRDDPRFMLVREIYYYWW